jgi:hypothetical protein
MNGRIKVVLLTVMAFGCGAAAMRATLPNVASAATSASAATTADVTEQGTDAPTQSRSTLQSVVVPRSANNSLRIRTTGGTPTLRLEFGNFTTKVPVQNAGTTLNCGSGSFHLKTGTQSGSCTVDYAGGSATCTDGANSSTAKCVSGCGNTNGSGDCTQN